MPIPQDKNKPEHPSTYFVQDRQNEEELTRVTIQDHMITAAMGGVLPEHKNISKLRRVLDIGCGTGGWIIDTAQEYPELSLIGVDVSQRMISHAREQAFQQHVEERVEFLVMDALRMLEFPNAYFDLVNMRLGSSFLRTWDWRKLFSEMLRVTHAGGVIRVTEPEIINHSNSPSHMRLHEMLLCALFQAGHLFTQGSTGLTAKLPELFYQYGCQQVQTRPYVLAYRAGTQEGQAYYNDVVYGFRTLRPFIRKWGCLAEDYDAIYRQAIEEVGRSDFQVSWTLHCVWGIRP
ncbi:class I SAM-dependent methyltransferase [Ktedonosporobacter rubrisoli]|uniref:Class I SAM-dependent methyltransferase n=1 Tax=Ktedonosporobacter rubrisoli TaxID=2509675 RepID=A0A4P6JNB0_KTERU|nr:class I SAM-dependent methyltransferase [Ktedonosporobacter rubrisoli]QBD76754.1 class I SAM-dependent methyltransferase [Ktedonosporobacter rubrisoli]